MREVADAREEGSPWRRIHRGRSWGPHAPHHCKSDCDLASPRLPPRPWASREAPRPRQCASRAQLRRRPECQLRPVAPSRRPPRRSLSLDCLRPRRRRWRRSSGGELLNARGVERGKAVEVSTRLLAQHPARGVSSRGSAASNHVFFVLVQSLPWRYLNLRL